MWASSQGIREGVELKVNSNLMREHTKERSDTHQKCIMAMPACHTTHSWHCWHRWSNRRWRKVDDALAIGPGTGDPLWGALADEQTIAGTSNVLFTGRRVSNRLWGETGETTFLWNHHEGGIEFPYRCFIALITLHHMLFSLPRDVNHSWAYATSHLKERARVSGIDKLQCSRTHHRQSTVLIGCVWRRKLVRPYRRGGRLFGLLCSSSYNLYKDFY